MKSFFKGLLIAVFGVIAGWIVMFGIGAIVLHFISEGMGGLSQSTMKNQSILHIRVKGNIVEHARQYDFDFMSSGLFREKEHELPLLETMIALRRAKEDDRISGVLLDISGFQGGWASLTSLRRSIEDFSSSKKFVYAFAEVMDEKAYYLASAAERIFIPPSGDFEINGLAANPTFFKGTLDKLELKARVFRVGRFKAAVEPFLLEKMSDENRLQTQTLIDDIWSVARLSFAKSTRKTEAQIDEIVAGLTLATADEAKREGFISDLAYDDELEAILKEMTIALEEGAKGARKSKGSESEVDAGKTEAADSNDADGELRWVSVMQMVHEKPKHENKDDSKKIGLIFADGEMVRGHTSHGQIGSDDLISDIDDAVKDERVKVIVLRINSPGGDALAADLIWRAIILADKKKPVIVSMGDVAASGGYYMAAGARYVFAEPTTITGSIGVFGLMFDTEKLFRNKVGLSFDRAVTHPYADVGNSNRPMSDVETKHIQKNVEAVYSRFLNAVEEGRQFNKRENLEKIAEGRVWTGLRAKELGLVDELGGLIQAFDKAGGIAKIDRPYPLEIYPKQEDPFTEILKQITGEESRFGLRHIGRSILVTLLNGIGLHDWTRSLNLPDTKLLDGRLHILTALPVVPEIQ